MINNKKKELKRDGTYDKKIDQFVIVFDRDSFEKDEDYFKFIEQASEGNILTITSPCFEIWLVLHYENAIIEYIKPNRHQIFENEKAEYGKQLFKLLSKELTRELGKGLF